jgi:hypothetical protein
MALNTARVTTARREARAATQRTSRLVGVKLNSSRMCRSPIPFDGEVAGRQCCHEYSPLGCCAALKMSTNAALRIRTWWAEKAPPGECRAGSWCSVRIARTLTTDLRRPWERPAHDGRLTPPGFAADFGAGGC